MIASLLVSFKITLKQIREKEKTQYGKHDKEFYQDDPPQLPAPGHSPESIIIKAEYFFYHRHKNQESN
jgi:hypothetical protein